MQAKISIFQSTILVFLITTISCGGPRKYNVAYVEKKVDQLLITLRGKGVGIPSAPLDAFFPKTFDDSAVFFTFIKRDSVNFNEVFKLNTRPKIANDTVINGEIFKRSVPIEIDTSDFVKGSIVIHQDELKIDLYQINSVSRQIEPIYWNGEYSIKWVK